MSSPAAERAGPGFAAIHERVRGAVERVAAVDPHPTDPFRGLYVSDEQALALAAADPPEVLDERLDGAVARLGLGALDAAVLALCAAPELDPRYGRLLAYLHDDVTRRLPSPRLAARLLAGARWTEHEVLACFDAESGLRRAGAIRLLEAGEEATPLAERPVRLAEPLLAAVMGVRLHRSGGPRVRHVAVPGHDPGRPGAIAQLRGLLAVPGRPAVLVVGADAAELLAAALGRPLLLARAGDAAAPELMADAGLRAALAGAQLCFEGLEELAPEERAGVAGALGDRPRGVLLCARERRASVVLEGLPTVLVEAPMPSFAERRAMWERRTGTPEVAGVAAKFRLSMAQIDHAAAVAGAVAAARGEGRPGPADLDRGGREASSARLGELATRLEPGHGWDDLVLAEHPLRTLRSVSAYLRHRDLVLSDWGYDAAAGAGQGVKVLFAGDSGTGKTLAGRVLAADLGLDLYRIDLATVVSKYIGETEKNLDRIFDAAEGSNAIIFFDEADALFGKRSEVRDAHDRYANIEVAYLLQKMEAYPGAVILATNLRSNMDDAFLRRLDFAVDFPLPEARERARIWRRLLPARAPVAPDVDVEFLAGRFRLSGGSIRNCSLAAAFLAADDGGEISMRHLVTAVAGEYAKLGRLRLEADFERFHGLIRAAGDGGAPGDR